MDDNLKIDKDYIDAFNLGYELAKELNLKSPMFKDLNSDNTRMNAMQAGMIQYNNEMILKNRKKYDKTQDLDNDKQTSIDADSQKSKGNKGKGFDMSI